MALPNPALHGTVMTGCAHCYREIFVTVAVALICCLLTAMNAHAKHNSEHPLSNDEWQEVMEKVSLLDNAVLIPSLLPVLMTNRDALGLNDEQFERLHRWRREHYVNMINLMNEVIEKRVRFRIESLSASVSDEHLVAFQEEIQYLERDLLKIRLSCRAIIMETFSREQWEMLEFLVADDPKLGSLISQRNGITIVHNH